MSNKTPREFWIVRHFPRPCIVELKVYEEKPKWESLQLGDERIHTVEHRAYDEAMTMLNEAIRSIDSYCNANYSKKIKLIEGSNEDQFIKVLKKYQAWKDGK